MIFESLLKNVSRLLSVSSSVSKTFKYAQHARHESAMDGFANHQNMKCYFS